VNGRKNMGNCQITNLIFKKENLSLTVSLYWTPAYLRCLIPSKNLARTQKLIADHFSFTLHNLFSIFRQIELSNSEKIHLFAVLVRSVLNVCSEIWSTHKATDIEMIHLKFLRYILRVRKSTNLSALYGELDRAPLNIYRKITILKYWRKLISHDHLSLTFKIFSVLKFDADNNVSYRNENWTSHAKLKSMVSVMYEIIKLWIMLFLI
jgi:hypothetical protein